MLDYHHKLLYLCSRNGDISNFMSGVVKATLQLFFNHTSVSVGLCIACPRPSPRPLSRGSALGFRGSRKRFALLSTGCGSIRSHGWTPAFAGVTNGGGARHGRANGRTGHTSNEMCASRSPLSLGAVCASPGPVAAVPLLECDLEPADQEGMLEDDMARLSGPAALRVAPRRPPAAAPTPPSIQPAALRAASRASTVGSATLFGPLLADRTPGRDAGCDNGEKCGLNIGHS